MSNKDIFTSYNDRKQVIPFEIIPNEEHKSVYRYKFLPEFNPLLYAKIKPGDVGIDLISQSESNVKSLNDLTLPSKRGDSKNKLTDEQCIYLAWIGLWCGSLWYQMPEEQNFRLDQLLKILCIMKDNKWNIPIDLYQFIMQCCFNYGTPDMIIKLYDHLETLNMKPNGCMCSIYFKAILRRQKENILRKHNESIKEIISSKNNSIVEIKPEFILNSASSVYKNVTKNFKERTFCQVNELNIIGDKILVSMDKIQCINCEEYIDYELILKQANSLDCAEPLLEVDCPKCKRKLDPQISFRIGKHYTFCEPEHRTSTGKAAGLMTPQDLRKAVEALVLKTSPRIKIQVTKMREHYRKIYWNSIWHFKRQKLSKAEDFNLPYDLFLPYKKDVYYDHVVPTVSQVTLTTIDNWDEEDEDELSMQKKYEEKIKPKILHKHIETQTDELPIKKKIE